jgi:hypothetical protein
VLGSFGTSVGSGGGVESFYSGPRSVVARKKAKGQDSNHLIETDWEELPYTMMRITGARRPWDNNRVYWRDRTVQLGDIDLHLSRNRGDAASHYTAVYTRDELRRDFILHPSLEDDELRWSAPGISDVSLTSGQLAEKLLSKLVTFYTTSLS